jgi:3-isopropylmalate/(R)-2-methylmalate dehydratase small subunit
MRAFREHNGIVAPLGFDNIDTDQIVPKQFLKRVERSGFGKYLFYDWRFTPEGELRPEFVLNKPAYAGASILVTGRNFGCGSSREHAAWALADFGIRAVVAPSFADIFSTNARNNGILLVAVSDELAGILLAKAQTMPGYAVRISLIERRLEDNEGVSLSFDVDEFTRTCLLDGLDEIGLTLRHEDSILAWEQAHGY